MISRRILLSGSRGYSRNHHLRGARRSNNTSTSSSATASKASGITNTRHPRRLLPVVLASSAIGFVSGRQSMPSSSDHESLQHLPNGLPRTCDCDAPPSALTTEQEELHKTLKRIVGKQRVWDGRQDTTQTSAFLKGARLGYGPALYIVQPQTLKEVVEVVQAVIDADCTVLVQGQNTGLTGGSVPRASSSAQRPTVLVSMKALDTLVPIDGGKRVLCWAGVGLASLHEFLTEHFPDRESHSILGSTFLNPTTAAGVSLGSGGTQLRKGPAFTERALYLQVESDKYGKAVVKLVNTLGIQGFDQEEGSCEAHIRHEGVIRALDTFARNVKNGIDRRVRTSNETYGKEPASDQDYKARLCRHDSPEVNRYNADTKGRDCNRSEGKVLILASVHDTFEKPKSQKTYWISFNDLKTAWKFRQQVCLENPQDLPMSMEYMDRDAYDVIDRSGRVLGNTIQILGTYSPVVRQLWNFKLWIEAWNVRGASTIGDKIMFWLNPIMPSILPAPIAKMGTEKDHHLALTVGDFDGSLDRFVEKMKQFQKEQDPEKIQVYECTTPSENKALTAFRFVAAPAFRTYCVGNGIQGFSVDYALPRNGGGEAPPLDIMEHQDASSSEKAVTSLKRMRYSHFGCNVVHEDIAFPPGVDIDAIKYKFKKSVEHECNGKLPAEHGHGTEYRAPPPTQNRWKAMDPMNVMNPGVGGLPMTPGYKE